MKPIQTLTNEADGVAAEVFDGATDGPRRYRVRFCDVDSGNYLPTIFMCGTLERAVEEARKFTGE